MAIDKIKTVGQLRKVIENLSDDYEIEMRIRRKLSDDEIKELYNKYDQPYCRHYRRRSCDYHPK